MTKKKSVAISEEAQISKMILTHLVQENNYYIIDRNNPLEVVASFELPAYGMLVVKSGESMLEFFAYKIDDEYYTVM